MRDIKSAFPEKVIQYLVVTLPMFIFAVEQEPRWIVRAYQPETLLQCVFREWRSGYINIYRHVFSPPKLWQALQTMTIPTPILPDTMPLFQPISYTDRYDIHSLCRSLVLWYTVFRDLSRNFQFWPRFSDHLAFVCLLSNRRKLYCIFILYML